VFADSQVLNTNKQMKNPQFLMVHTKKESRFITEEDISACIANGNYTQIILSNKEEFTISKKLKSVEEKLNKSEFVRIHHSHIINIQHLEKYNNSGNQKVTLRNGIELEVSKRKKADFLARFKSF